MKGKISLICIIIFCAIGSVEAQSPANNADVNFPYKNMPEILPGTKPLTWDGDLSAKMLDGAHKFIEEKINESISIVQNSGIVILVHQKHMSYLLNLIANGL